MQTQIRLPLKEQSDQVYTVYNTSCIFLGMTLKEESVRSNFRVGRHGGLVVEHQTPEREVWGSILTLVAMLCP